MKKKYKAFILKALARHDGQPLTETALIVAVQSVYTTALVSDIREGLKELEMDTLIVGSQEPVTEQNHYLLTVKGAATAKTLA